MTDESTILAERWTWACRYSGLLDVVRVRTSEAIDLEGLREGLLERSGKRLDKGQLSRQLRKLIDLKLVAELGDSSDQRKKYFRITDEGQVIVDTLTSGEKKLQALRTTAQLSEVEPDEVDHMIK